MHEERGKELENYLKTAMTINKTDIDAAIENAELTNREVINEIIDPTPRYLVDEGFNVNIDLNRSDENETNFHLNKNLQKRLDDILKTPLSVRRLYTSDRNVESLPNNADENLSVETEDIYIEDSPLKDINFFIPPPTKTREDFEVNFKENDLIVFKSPTLPIVNIERKILINALENILNQANINIK